MKKSSSKSANSFTLGSTWFEKASAVEGVFLTEDEKAFFAELDAKKLPAGAKLKAVLAHVSSKI